MASDDFQTQYGPLASDISDATGLDPSVVLGHIAQETGYGQHIAGNNLFGISPGGKLATYPDIPTAAQAYVDLMNGRYAPIGKMTDPDAQAQALQTMGYNRNAGYGKAVASIAAKYRTAPSVDDIFNQTGPVAPAPTGPSADDIFNGTPDIAGTPPTSKPEPPNRPIDDWGIPQAPTKGAPSVVPDPDTTNSSGPGSIGQAMGDAYNNTRLLSPVGESWLNSNAPSVVSKYVYPEANALAGGVASLGAGGMAVLAGAGNKLSPGLGNDLAVVAQTAPIDLVSMPNGRAVSISDKVPTPGWVKATDNAIPTERVSPSGVAAAPGDLSAAATTTPIPPQTPLEEKTDFIKQSRQSAADRAEPSSSVRTDGTSYPTRTDTSVDVAGVQPLLGSVHYDPQIAIDTKSLMAKDPAFKAEVVERQTNNMNTIVDAAHDLAKDTNEVGRLTAERDQVAPDFTNEKPVDASGVVQQIDDILASPAGKQASVVKALSGVRDSMFDKDGNVETLPSQLWGARDNIRDKLAKAANAMDPESSDNRFASSQLNAIKQSIENVANGQDITGTQVIPNAGAPGLKDYLAKYRELSGPIDALTYLQKNLTGPGKIVNGVMSLNKVQGVLDDIEKNRWSGGTDPTQRLTPDQIQSIFNIRNALQREKYGTDLARTAGSDTVQQLHAAARLEETPSPSAVVTQGLGTMAMHGALAATTHGVGNMLLRGGEVVAGGLSAAKKAAQAKVAAQTMQTMQQKILGSHPNWEGPAY